MKTCARCGQPMTLDAGAGQYRCPAGHRVFETLEEAQARLQQKGARPAVPITFRGKLDQRTRSLFESAHDALWRDDREAALDDLQDALDIQPNFIDAHLWLAKLSDDPQVKRDHLESVLAHDPGNREGLREMLLLDGKITPEEAARSRSGAAPILRRVEQVKATTETLLCPVCGGDLTLDPANRRVVCKYCGHTAALPAPTDDGAQTFGAAMIARQGRGVVWQIGERVQRCTQCGSERTLKPDRLSGACPFCGATAVIVADAVGALEQPDAIVPFVVDEGGAKAALRERLTTLEERVYAADQRNRIAGLQLEGVYLPFWVFDAVIDVRRSITVQQRQGIGDRRRGIVLDNESFFQDGVLGLMQPAFSTPGEQLLRQVEPFSLTGSMAYDPRLLAKYPAALYTIDFEAAAQPAGGRASAISRARHTVTDSEETLVTASAFVSQMTFRLALLPFWMAVLTERDGDQRAALVNGSTGRAAVGRVVSGRQ